MEGERSVVGSGPAAVLGIAFLLAGAVAAPFLDGPLRWQVLFAATFLGAFLLVVLAPASRLVTEAGVTRASARSLARLAGDLDLQPNGIVVPAGHGPLSEDRVLLVDRPCSAAHLPHLDAARALYTGEVGGLALDPPGAPLLDAHEAARRVRLRHVAIGELAATLEGLDHGGRLVHGLAVRRTGERVRLRYRPGRHADLCRHLREEEPVYSTQIGCPTCSALVLAVARSARRPVRLASISEHKGDVILEVDLEWSA